MCIIQGAGALPWRVVRGLWGLLVREGSDRLQALPALLLGVALLLQSAWGRRRGRRALLTALQDQRGEC